MADSPGYCTPSDGEQGDSDRELQVAFERGLLKADGLSVAVPAKRPPINNQAALLAKLTELSANIKGGWVERLDVTVSRDAPSEDDDFKRELSFYAQAQSAATEALERLRSLRVATKRPEDFYAQMAKSDQQMNKVRKKLLTIQNVKERQETAKRMREERKFASGVQKQVLSDRRKDKRQLMEAVKKSKKGMQQQLNDMLHKHGRAMADGEEEEGNQKRERGPKTRAFRDKKYGFGGRKKGSKRNTADSTAHFDGADNKKGGSTNRKGPKPGTGGRNAKKKRPGQSIRKKLNAKKRSG